MPPAVLTSLRQLTSTGQYPRIVRMVNESEPYPSTDTEFAWQLDRVLDGLAATLPAATTNPSSP